MPGQMTAQQIVNRMRYYLKELGSQPYSDGIGALTSGTIPLLDFANSALDFFIKAGYDKVDFPVVVASGVREYPLDITAGKITDVTSTFSGVGTATLRNTTPGLLSTRIRDWRDPTSAKYAPTNPRLYYIDGWNIGLYPMPLSSGSLTIRATKTPSPMVSGSDVPTSVPAIYHGAIPILAAALVATSDAEDDAMTKRAAALFQLFQQEYPELSDLIDARGVIAQVAAAAPPGQEV